MSGKATNQLAFGMKITTEDDRLEQLNALERDMDELLDLIRDTEDASTERALETALYPRMDSHQSLFEALEEDSPP